MTIKLEAQRLEELIKNSMESDEPMEFTIDVDYLLEMTARIAHLRCGYQLAFERKECARIACEIEQLAREWREVFI